MVQETLFDRESTEDSGSGVLPDVTVTCASESDPVLCEGKRKRSRRVTQHSLEEGALEAPRRSSPRKRRDRSIRTLFREKMAELDLTKLRKPWMASKSFLLLDSDQALADWVDRVLADKSCWVAPYKKAEPVPCVAVDTETIGLDTRILVDVREARNPDGSLRYDERGNVVWEATYEVKIEIAGVCLSVDGVSGVYIPINHESCKNVSRDAAQAHLQRLFDAAHLIFYNAKFDREVMRHTLGIKFREYPHFEDVQALHFSNDPKAREDDDTFTVDAHGLKGLSRELLGFEQIDLAHIGKVQAEWCSVTGSPNCNCSVAERKQYKHGLRMQYVPFTWVPTSIALWYAAADAICTWLLWFRMKDEAQSRVRVHKIDGEMIDTLTWIERQRFRIAEEPHARMVRWHTRQMAERRENLRQIAVRMGWQELTDDEGNIIEDTKFNVDKKHLPKFLFETLRLEIVKKTAKGQPSTDKDAMLDLLKKYPRHEFLLALDEYKKYVALHPENLRYDPKDKSARIYLKQSVVAGGRLAASGGAFDRDGGFGLNVQAIKKVGGNWFVKGRILEPEFVSPEDVERYEESDLHPSCFREKEEEVIVGWRQMCRDGSEGGKTVLFTEQFPSDINDMIERQDPCGDLVTAPKYADDAPERHRQPVVERKKVRRQAPGIINNHIANFLGYSICLVSSCTSCASKFGVLIDKGKLDANQVLNLRALFIADDGWTMLASDYSNIEMRCAANISGEPRFVNEFLYGSGDFHTLTATAVFSEFSDPSTSAAVRKTYRDLAKIINFALLYGGSEFTLLENMKKKRPDITMKDCKRMVTDYWNSVPVFKAFCEEKQRQAREEMRCFTDTGRVIKFDSAMKAEGITVPSAEDWEQYWAYVRVRKAQREAESAGRLEEAAHLKEVMDRYWKDPSTGVRNTSDYNKFMSKIQRVAVNVPLQGLAGDFMRMALNRIRKWATQDEPFVQSVFRLHCSVHDEIDYAVKNDYLPFVVPRVTRLMKLRTLHALRKWPVGIECDTEYGRSWDVAFHLTGDSDHAPSGWTDVTGMEEYLPGEFDVETVDSLVRAIASGKDTGRSRADAWAKDNLHERAYKSFWYALWTLDKEKKPIPLTDAEVVRKRVFAALQLHEYWTIDTTPDDAGSTLETLVQYEERRGLTPGNRGWMPLGGYLGTLPLNGVVRPVPEPLGAIVVEEASLSEHPPINRPVPETVEAPLAVSEAPPPLPVPDKNTQRDASEMASDDLLDELLHKELPRAQIQVEGLLSVPRVPVIERVRPGTVPEAPEPKNVPVLRDLSLPELNALKRLLVPGLGCHEIAFMYQGRRWRLQNCVASEIPCEYLKEDVYA